MKRDKKVWSKNDCRRFLKESIRRHRTDLVIHKRVTIIPKGSLDSAHGVLIP